MSSDHWMLALDSFMILRFMLKALAEPEQPPQRPLSAHQDSGPDIYRSKATAANIETTSIREINLPLSLSALHCCARQCQRVRFIS